MNADTLLNDFAIPCFRESADQDYIAARMSYRAGLIPQFHWSGLQAVEKYLKAILLLNRIDARSVKHDLNRALEHARKLPFDIKLSRLAMGFIGHLDRFGRYRYLETSFFVYGPKLAELDRTIWEIRRYCKVVDYVLEVEGGREKNMLQSELGRIACSESKPPHKFQLPNGLLERILDMKDHPARNALIWQNAFFGSYSRKKVKVPTHFQATNAPLALHPQILDEVIKYVHVPWKVVAAYREVSS
jgi:hypothetical protein